MPFDIADEISKSIKNSKKPENKEPVDIQSSENGESPPTQFDPVTSGDVRGWAIDQQINDLEGKSIKL